MQNSFFITLGNSHICIHQFGNGPQLLIAFHGFRETGWNMAVLGSTLGNDFTIYAPDLPFSGLTEWNTNYFLPDDLKQLIDKMTTHFGITHFSLLGFSLGGRIALSLIPEFIGQTDHLILLAPDGLKVNFWYAFATRTLIGRRLFRYITYHPGLFHLIIKCGLRSHLVNESIYKFVSQHTSHEQERLLVYRIGACLKDIRPDMSLVIRNIKKKELPTILFFGRYDRIFPPESGNFLKDIPSVHIQIMESGHQLLNKEVAIEINYCLIKNNSGL